MVAHSIVVVFLLLFPWALVAVWIVAAIASAIKRRVGYISRARHANAVLPLTRGLRGESLPRFYPHPQRDFPMRKAA